MWICPLRDGHIQATGRDARGRKQYRYHPRWREVRDSNKYFRLVDFGAGLPGPSQAVRRAPPAAGPPAREGPRHGRGLLDETLIRVGNDEYAISNESYGLTTMQDEHARVEGSLVQFEFTGKSGVEPEVELRDRRLARIVKACQDLPGEEPVPASSTTMAGQVDVTSTMVNDYLREISGADFTAKDFRTWGGTVVAAESSSWRAAGGGVERTPTSRSSSPSMPPPRSSATRGRCAGAATCTRRSESHVDGFFTTRRSTRSTTRSRRGERTVLKVLQQHAAQEHGASRLGSVGARPRRAHHR